MAFYGPGRQDPRWWQEFEGMPEWARNIDLERYLNPPQAPQAPQAPSPAQDQFKFFPEFYGNIFSRLTQEQEKQRGTEFEQLRGLMGQGVGQLGQQLGQQFGRTNMPIAGGTQMLANRLLGPMQTQMQNWFQSKQQPSWEQRVGSTLQMAQTFWPMFQPHMEEGGYWKAIMNKFMKQLFGG